MIQEANEETLIRVREVSRCIMAAFLALVGYVTTLFKLGAIFTILWARLFLGEGQARSRLLGACVMVSGGVLVAM